MIFAAIAAGLIIHDGFSPPIKKDAQNELGLVPQMNESQPHQRHRPAQRRHHDENGQRDPRRASLSSRRGIVAAISLKALTERS